MKSQLIKRLKQIRDKEQAARDLLDELRPERRAVMEALYRVEGMTMSQIAVIYGVKDRRDIDNIINDRHGKKRVTA